ncbi:MAG: hypothetical protein AUJ18_00115 [Candidatus Hydrogenedentes bacterium CG1_02_42_14]|nr:MAG: hypothetical protein AUJ18_00115 [Candidatus Hydrogenedentes bacterium CG1_02_42_14]
MNINFPSQNDSSQSFIAHLFRVILSALRIFSRRETYLRIFQAVDFLLSNEIYTYASAIAFNVLIAFFPAVIVVLTVVNQVGGHELHGAALRAIADYLPSNREFFIAQISLVSRHFTGMTLFSLVILLFTAVGIFVPVELALNYVWKEPKPRHWLVSQMISFFLLGVFVMMSLLPIFISWGFGRILDTIFFFAVGSAFLKWINWLIFKLVTVPFTIAAFAIILSVLPNRKMKMEEVIPAAIFSGVVFEIGKYVYIVSLPLLGLKEIYGAFVVSVTFVTWALFASMIMLMGVYLTAQDLLPKWRPAWSTTATKNDMY